MKKFLKIISIVIVLLIIVVATLFFMPDDELSENAKTWLVAPVDNEPENNIFNGLQGFGVKEGSDFIQEGILITNRINQKISDYRAKYAWNDENTDAIEFESSSPNLKATFERDNICSADTKNCIDFWKNNRENINKLVDENSVLLKRKQALSKLTTYTTTTAVDIFTPYPDFVSYSNITNLQLNHHASNYLETTNNESLVLIYNEITQDRNLLSKADGLIAKMIAAANIKRSIYTLSQLADVSKNINYFDKITPLSKEEISLAKAFKSEFLLQSSLFLGLGKQPENIASLGFSITNFPEVIIRRQFKKNISINNEAVRTSQIILLSETPSSKYYEASKQSKPYKACFTDYIRNPIGTILTNVATPNFAGYIERQHDLNGLITLYNLKLNILKNKADIKDINTYLASKADEYFDPYLNEAIKYNSDTKELYFNSPDLESRTNKLHLSLD